MLRSSVPATLLALTAAVGLASATSPATAAVTPDGRPSTYLLDGDAAGSRFEGIGADQRRGVFYVSEVTGGEIHRGVSGTAQAVEWLPGDGADGRTTARGITVDAAGRVYVAGGPNGLGTGRPDLWVYSPSGALLAALRVPAGDAFLNDVAIGPDGAAYFTNSNDPQVFRVADDGSGWHAELWADASGTVERMPGFNLGGIVLTADQSAFVVAQGNTGRLWRFDAGTGAVSEVATGGADLVNADGLVRRGGTLLVVRNFSRMLATLRLSADGRTADLVRQDATDPARVLTTAKVLRGQVLFVDSKFDEQPVASPPYEVVTDPVVR